MPSFLFDVFKQDILSLSPSFALLYDDSYPFLNQAQYRLAKRLIGKRKAKMLRDKTHRRYPIAFIDFDKYEETKHGEQLTIDWGPDGLFRIT